MGRVGKGMERRIGKRGNERWARRLLRGPVVLSLVLMVPFFWISLGRGKPEDLPKVAREIEERFPTVEHVTVPELERELQRPPRERPLLVDVRTAEEFAVSHLPEAVRAETEEEALDVLSEVPKDREIVVYCAVGYRSAEMAEALEEQGFTKVRNLSGSLFAWANSGRPVVGEGGEPVRRVHPYDRKWGKLLRDELHAEP